MGDKRELIDWAELLQRTGCELWGYDFSVSEVGPSRPFFLEIPLTEWSSLDQRLRNHQLCGGSPISNPLALRERIRQTVRSLGCSRSRA